MRAAFSLGLVLAGCLSVAHWMMRSKVLWLGIGCPLLAIGLGQAGFNPASALEALARKLLVIARDLRIIGSMLADAPGEFRDRRDGRDGKEQS